MCISSVLKNGITEGSTTRVRHGLRCGGDSTAPVDFPVISCVTSDSSSHISNSASHLIDEQNNEVEMKQPKMKPFSDLRPPHDMKRSVSFGGFKFDETSEMSPQELESMIDSTKKDVSKFSKIQIKEYSTKYKHLAAEKLKKKVAWYKEALENTQGAHLVTILAVVYLAFRLFPDSRRSQTEASTLTRLLYVTSISTVFGAQIWMTFVSGLALFFTLPRHTFAKVQEILFPLYFLFISVLMLVVIVTYTQHQPTHLWGTYQLSQGIALVFCFIVNLFIRLYLAPVMTKLITIKMAIESETGLGSEVGSSQPGVLSRCPHYMRLYRTFRKIHMSIALGNMAAMAATSFHLYYLATKLCSVQI